MDQINGHATAKEPSGNRKKIELIMTRPKLQKMSSTMMFDERSALRDIKFESGILHRRKKEATNHGLA
jgi:hypothetical protein